MAEKTMNEKEKYLDEIEDKIRTIGVLTSGGDAPGMNAAIRAVVRRALAKGLKVRGIRRGYHGLLKEEIIDLTARDVSDIVQRGGTILQTARCKTMRTEEGQQKAAAICKKYGIDGLVVIGGQKRPQRGPPITEQDAAGALPVSLQELRSLQISELIRSVFRERSIWISPAQIIRSDLIQRLIQLCMRSIKFVILLHLMRDAVSLRLWVVTQDILHCGAVLPTELSVS